jgi:cysteine desulfurase
MIYFDHNATTSIHPEVLETMMPFLESQQGNPSSSHSYGRHVQTAIEEARERVANSVNAHPSQVIFTSSGTESNNTVIHGISRSYPDSHFGYSAIEHPCISEPIKSIESLGFKNTRIPVDKNGLLDTSGLNNEEQKSITFLSVMMANNETGVLQDMPKIIKWAKAHNIQVHTDAVQAVGKINVDFEELGIDAMTISSHKIYGPQGAAALILNKKIDLYPHLMGGGQEKGLRSGTENIAAIVGFGKACERVQKNIVITNNKVKDYRLLLEKELRNLGAIIFADQTERLGNTTFFAFSNIDGSTLLTALDRKGYAIASGSACSSNSSEASHVLLAMGIKPELAQGALRVSLGIDTKENEIKRFLESLKVEVNRLKQLTAMAA